MSGAVALIIEDDYDLAIIFSEALQAAGFEAEIIRSGDLAMKRLSTIVPDVVILDLHLPEVAGPEILRHIRTDPRLEGLPVIVATAYPHIADTLRKDANLVLIKPVSFTQLRDLSACFLRTASPVEE